MRVGKDYGDIFDHHSVEYTYADGTKMFSFCRQIPGCEPLVGEFVVGSKEKPTSATGGSPPVANSGRFPSRAAAPRGRPGPNPYQVEHDALFAAIRNGTPHMEAETGAQATMTAILGRMATYTGRTVTWEEGFQSKGALGPEQIVDWKTMPLTCLTTLVVQATAARFDSRSLARHQVIVIERQMKIAHFFLVRCSSDCSASKALRFRLRIRSR